MVKFKLEGKEYKLPEFISISDYVKISKVKDLFTDEYFYPKLINILTSCPLEDLLECGFEEINYLAYSIISILPKEKDITFMDRFELDGVQYGFIPNWRDLTFAEFIDMDTISSKKTNELLDMLHILGAIMYRPIITEISEHNFTIEDYDIELMKKRSELFKNRLDIKIILGGQFFFINFVKKFSDYTQPSSTLTLSIWDKIKIIWIMWRMIYKGRSKNHSVGFWSSTEFVRTTLQNMSTSTKKT
jgi:hypothetical protein